MEDFNLEYKGLGHAIDYSFQKWEDSQLFGVTSSNQSRGKAHVRYGKNVNENKFFNVAISQFEQEKNEGMYGWVADTMPLREKLSLEILPDGSISKVNNLPDIHSKWYELKKRLEKTHGKDALKNLLLDGIGDTLSNPVRFTDTIRHASPFSLLLPPIYGQWENSLKKGYRELKNFPSVKMLPVNLRQVLTAKENGQLEIEVDGELDHNGYNQDSVREFVKTLKNRPRAVTEITLRYKERYLLDELHRPIQSMLMYMAIIPGFMYQAETIICKFLTPETV